jgi:HD-like signal output (HDOD) protein
MSAKVRILFVDDEPPVLRGLSRAVAALSDEWEAAYAENGAQALRLLAQHPFDVVVTDLRMPGMSGAQLLAEVKQRYPQTMRVVLSGQVSAGKELAFAMLDLAHQYLPKPCDVETLRSVLARANALRSWLAADALKQLIAQLSKLPSMPAMYTDLMQELRSPEASIKTVGQIIARDMAMTAKMLQLVNSAFFGLRRRVSDPAQAALLLGLDTVKTLALSIHLFAQFEGGQVGSLSLRALQEHVWLTGALARRIAEAECDDRQLSSFAFTAGLLHDIGILVLAANLPAEYSGALALAKQGGIPLTLAEQQVLGAAHAEVGAYLLGLWGLPYPIVEAVAYHHAPYQGLSHGFSPLTAVYAANVLASEVRPVFDLPLHGDRFDDYLAELNCVERVPHWRALCSALVEQDGSQ